MTLISKTIFTFGVTVDFLIWEGENTSYDKETVERINDIQKMDVETKSVLFNIIDTYIQILKLNRLLDKQQSHLIGGFYY
ncbi:hypothetical protein [Flavobacterium kingsejongi]|uniref:hypothetical protein n=1 Tax=Flavobacterium kingsejongi TaxID=1678728 RepID=UPI0013007CEA|nr:hypothetical protein [Flavobacterium kingsejongi]